MIMSYYKMSDTQGFMFYIQSIIVTPSTKSSITKEMICYFDSGRFLHGTNIITDKVIFKAIWNPPTIEVTTLGSTTTYSTQQEKYQLNFYVNY